ncbi:MAG: NAD(P)/FAD-dependent oxidoreductase [Prosthecobacter sp.]|nr:NAD(P)/FAD-dependent oxidoreductase [Prosthecobacter sp.]
MRKPSDYSRRQVLQIASGTALAGLLPEGAAQSATAKKPKKVIVVGGGIGGLSCAYELMGLGHEVTLLEASRRTGGHVKTIRDPLPDGLYADVGAEHFTNPGYDQYRKWVEKFDLPVLPWARRQEMYRNIGGKWYTEADLKERAVVEGFGFNQKEVNYILEHGWTELSFLYLAPYVAKFRDEYQPFGVGLDDWDQQLLGDILAKDGASEAALRFIGGGRSKPGEKVKATSDSSALYRVWQAAIPRMRGLPAFKKEVFHLKGGNQLLPDTFASKLGDRVRKNCVASAIEHDEAGAKVTFTQEGKEQTLSADYVVMCVSPLVMPAIKMTPAWPEAKAFALSHTPMGMQSRVLLQCRTPFWKGDVPSINLETGNSAMGLVYQTAADVPGERCVLMGSGQPAQTPEATIAAFRKFYPGKNKDTIEQCIVHQWWKEEPYAVGCERHAFPFGQLAKLWPHLIEPVGRIHFAGAAYDNLPWGQDAATRSAHRVAGVIDAA